MLHFASAALALVAFVTGMIAVTTNGWIIASVKNPATGWSASVEASIWEVCTTKTGEGKTCQKLSDSATFAGNCHSSSAYVSRFQAVQAFGILQLISSFAAAAIIGAAIVGKKQALFAASGGASLFSGVSALICFAITLGTMDKYWACGSSYCDGVEQFASVNKVTPSCQYYYSFGLMVVACGLGLIAGVLAIVYSKNGAANEVQTAPEENPNPSA